MNSQEARDVLESGNGIKLTHRLFLSNEYITIIDDMLQDESGHYLRWDIFWEDRKSPQWMTDWSIFKEKKKKTNTELIQMIIDLLISEECSYDDANYIINSLKEGFNGIDGPKIVSPHLQGYAADSIEQTLLSRGYQIKCSNCGDVGCHLCSDNH